MLLAGCRDAPPDDRDAATAPDTAQLRMVAESAAAHDSAVVRNERRAVLAPAGEGWTTGSTAIQLSAGSLATLRSVRESEHEGFDRVVFDFGERSLPNYELAYVESPQHQCGSGEAVRLKGEAWLSIKLQPVQAHDDTGRPTVAERSREPGLEAIRELRLMCDSLAQVEWVAGLARRGGYRAMMLQQPTRLVVDVRH